MENYEKFNDTEVYYEKFNKELTTKPIDDIDLNLLSTADMNSYVLASKDKPIIGTYALASCLGLLIYDNEGNYALAHILEATEYESIIKEMVNCMKNTGPLKVNIIPGSDTRVAKVYEIARYLKSKNNYFLYDFDIVIKYLKNYINEELGSIEFAFDTIKEEYIRPNYKEYINRRGV